jgi:hypothetical protein
LHDLPDQPLSSAPFLQLGKSPAVSVLIAMDLRWCAFEQRYQAEDGDLIPPLAINK